MRRRSLAAIVVVAVAAAGSVVAGRALGFSGPDATRGVEAGAAKSQTSRPRGLLVLGCSGCPANTTGPSLYTLTPGGRLQVVPGTEGADDPSWSPDGRFIAYSVGGGHELRVVSVDGSRSRRLTGPFQSPTDARPDWSPNGRTVAFVRLILAPDSSHRGSLWRVPATGGRATRMHAPRYGVQDAGWSPNGRTIAYSDARQKLWLVEADGSRQRALGPRTLRGWSPRFAPDGRRVAFIEVGRVQALSVLDLATSRLRRLLILNQSAQVFDLAWSPDGRWVALSRILEFPCEGVPPPGLCDDFQVLAVRVSDRARRGIYRADDGGPSGLDWR